jgi:hypothetical protein
LTADINLSISPPVAMIKASAGSMRSLVLTAQNLSDESVDVVGSLLIPDELRPKTLTDTAGEYLNCTKWLTLKPEHFTLGALERAGMRFIIKLPEEVELPPHLYSQLLLQWKYPNGEIAGEETLPITINIPSSKIAEQIQAEAQSIDIVHQTDNAYAVKAKFTNTGNTDFSPTATADISAGVAQADALSKTLETTTTHVLPRGSVQFSGDLDFGQVKQGVYTMTVAMTYGGKTDATARLSIKVEDQDGKKVIMVLEKPSAGKEATADMMTGKN